MRGFNNSRPANEIKVDRVKMIETIIKNIRLKEIDHTDERSLRAEACAELDKVEGLTSVERISLENMIVNQTLTVKISSR